MSSRREPGHAVQQCVSVRRGRQPAARRDIVNRGPDSLGCIRMVLDCVGNGAGAICPGNHEMRLAYMIDAPHRLDDVSHYSDAASLATLRGELARNPGGIGLVRAFADLLRETPIWRTLGGATFCHAAMPGELRGMAAPLLGGVARGDDPVLDMVLWGQRQVPGGQPVYDWVDSVPGGEAVFVGHHPVSLTHPVRVTGRHGGIAVLCDTGCGIHDGRGRLSALELDFRDLEDVAGARQVLDLEEAPVVMTLRPGREMASIWLQAHSGAPAQL